MAAEVLELGKDGKTLSHKVIAFGGKAADSGDIVDTVEMIDFAKPQPWKWGAPEAALSAGVRDEGHPPSRRNGPHRRRERTGGYPRAALQLALPALQPGRWQHEETARQDNRPEEQP